MAEYIEREEAIAVIKNYGKGAIADGMKALDPVDDIVALIGAIEWLQVADVAPVVHGRWEYHTNFWRCSHCDAIAPMLKEMMQINTDYCPNCGAKMDEVSE